MTKPDRIMAIAPRPWSLGRIVSRDGKDKPTGNFALLDANGHCLGVATREDDGILIIEAVNAYQERPVLIHEQAKGTA